MESLENQNLTKKQRRELKRQAKLARRASAARGTTARTLGIWVGVLAGIALVIFGLIKLGGSGTTNVSSTGGAPAPVTANDWVAGNATASTTLIEYSDFECPACAVAEPVAQSLRREFGSRVRFVYRYFPLAQHPVSGPSAQAAEAAGKQGKFWEMHDMLFAGQREWAGNPNGATETFTRYATSLNLAVARFKTDLESADIKQKIADQSAEGTRAGVDSTPTFFLNGKKLQLTGGFNYLRDEILTALGGK